VELDGRILLVEGVTGGGDEIGGMDGRDVDWGMVDGVPVDGFGREGVEVDVERYMVMASTVRMYSSEYKKGLEIS